MLKVTHGSPSEFSKFKFFNYSHDQNTKKTICLETNEELSFSGKGLDTHGIGIYSVKGIKTKEVKYYAGESVYCYILSVDADILTNNKPNDLISVVDWKILIQSTIEKIREMHNFRPEEFIKASDIYINNEFRAEDRQRLVETLTNMDDSVNESEIPTNEIEFSEWYSDKIYEIEEYLDPASFILEELACCGEDYIQKVINNSKNLADVKDTIESLFFHSDGTKYKSYNKAFYESCRDHPNGIMQHLTASSVSFGDTEVIVIFDIEKININRVIEMSKHSKKEAEEITNSI